MLLLPMQAVVQAVYMVLVMISTRRSGVFKRTYAILLLMPLVLVQHKYINLLLLVVLQQTHFYC
jgi:hypothetical protein